MTHPCGQPDVCCLSASECQDAAGYLPLNVGTVARYVAFARAALGRDLGGRSVVDLVADRWPGASLADVKAVLQAAAQTRRIQ